MLTATLAANPFAKSAPDAWEAEAYNSLLETARNDDAGRLSLLLDSLQRPEWASNAAFAAAGAGAGASLAAALEFGVDPTSVTPECVNPDVGADMGSMPLLHAAVSSGCVNTVRVLLERGVSVDTRDGLGETAVHVAVRSDDVAMLRFLLDVGADSSPRSYGPMPLRLALSLRRGNCVVMLVEAGADA